MPLIKLFSSFLRELYSEADEMSNYGTDDLYGQGNTNPAGESAGITKAQEVKKAPSGYGGLIDSRVFGNRATARAKPSHWHVSKDDRMSAEQARDTVEKIQEAFDITKTASHEDLDAFWEAVFFYHTVNSGSVAQPGRSTITFGHTTVPYSQVLTVLGNDQRRFFRAMANEVREVNRKVLANAGNRTIEDREKAEWLRQVADERGLGRYPDLAHDSADACWGLDPAQSAAIANSKMAVTGRTANFVDTYSANARLRSQGGTVNDNPAVWRGQNV